jgi:hypothetical protein
MLCFKQIESCNWELGASSLKTMQFETGFVFQEPKTDFVWKISSPWMNRDRKKQLGWICKRVGPNPEQLPVSNWYEHEIINLLKQAEVPETPRVSGRGKGAFMPLAFLQELFQMRKREESSRLS